MKLGLTCISEQLKDLDKKKYSFQTMTRKRFLDLCETEGKSRAISQLSERILHNLNVTKSIVAHCIDVGIAHYRMSSALFPLITDETLDLSIDTLPNVENIKHALKQIGALAADKVSIGSHPDQFNVLASDNPDAVRRTIKELNFHAKVFDLIGLPQDYKAPINIHINASPKGTGCGISEVANKFALNLKKCDTGLIKRLTVENEDKGTFSVSNILLFHKYLKRHYNFHIPVCWDNLHDKCNNGNPDNNLLANAKLCKATWPVGVTPVFHWSEGKPEKPRAHADYVADGNLPFYLGVKWEIETKAKDKAIARLKKQIKKQLQLTEAIS